MIFIFNYADEKRGFQKANTEKYTLPYLVRRT